MPRIVNQEQKRADIARAAYEVVARDGLASTTMRAIAKQAGCSTGMLVHYFTDKQDVLLNAHVHAVQTVRSKMQAAENSLAGMALLKALVEETLPADARRRGNWLIWMAFWDPSVADNLAGEQRKRVAEWHRRLKRALLQAESMGELRAGLNIQDEVARLASLVEGLAILVIVHKHNITRSRQLRLVNGYLDGLLSNQRNGVDGPAVKGSPQGVPSELLIRQ